MSPCPTALGLHVDREVFPKMLSNYGVGAGTCHRQSHARELMELGLGDVTAPSAGTYVPVNNHQRSDFYANINLADTGVPPMPRKIFHAFPHDRNMTVQDLLADLGR